MPRHFSWPLCIALLTLPALAYGDCMGPYPPSMVRAFNQNCATDPKMLGFCSCIMDEVQKNIPLAEFIEIGNSTAGINNDPRFIKASAKCTPLMSGAPVASSPVSSPTVSAAPAKTAPAGK